MGLFDKKKLAFEKIELSHSTINSDETTKIKINVRNFKESFENIVVKINTDDKNEEYLKISDSVMRLSSLTLPNQNTGDHEITIIPHNIPLRKMSFNIRVELFGNDSEQPILTKEFDLMISKK